MVRSVKSLRLLEDRMYEVTDTCKRISEDVLRKVPLEIFVDHTLKNPKRKVHNGLNDRFKNCGFVRTSLIFRILQVSQLASNRN